jgi:hypothetical protein
MIKIIQNENLLIIYEENFKFKLIILLAMEKNKNIFDI